MAYRSLVTAIVLACASYANAQQTLHIAFDSGVLTNTGTHTDVLITREITAPDASWIRLEFGDVRLAGPIDAPDESRLVVTALEDGAVQTLNARQLAEWGHTSAYFNGDAVRVELIASPGTGDNRVEIVAAMVGRPGDPIERSLCNTDDRVPSNSARDGRYMPIACSASLIGERSFLSAGHCVAAPGVVQFNVPLSNPDGTLRHPSPDDQYAVDPASMQSASSAAGNDWAFFGCFDNPNTGLSPLDVQGEHYQLAGAVPPADGRTLRLTGYGTVSAPVDPRWNGAQKTHTGPFADRVGSVLSYTVDTTGGNSGGIVLDETTGLAIGLHTHNGCDWLGGNRGTAIDHPPLVDALGTPLGVCRFGDCIADVTTLAAAIGQLGYGTPDGVLSGDDIFYFVNAWIDDDLSVADLTTTGAAEGGTGFGVPDQQISGADLYYFTNAWFTGCAQ